MSSPPKLALVLSGGGARGAYEAGVLHYIRTQLPEPVRHTRFDIITGSSVGAINAALFAAAAHTPDRQGFFLREVWSNIDQRRIYRRDWAAIGRLFLKFGWGAVSNFLSFDPGKRRLPLSEYFVSVFDTSPMPVYLEQLVDLGQIGANLAQGHLSALAIAATSLTTDRTELFVQKRPEIKYNGPYQIHQTPLHINHLLASAAIPFAFPSVKVGDGYYYDGSMRLTTPISPAIQLGADRILVIGMHSETGNQPYSTDPEKKPRAGRLLASVTEATFQDRVSFDFEQLTRINRIIEWGEKTYGPDFLKRINDTLVASNIHGDIADRGLKRIDALAIQPSRDLAQVFQDTLPGNPYLDKNFSTFERLVMRAFDIDPREGSELFSFLAFSPEYIGKLLELGYADAANRHDDLVAFFEGKKVASLAPHLELA